MSGMAEVLRGLFAVEATGEYGATAVWATPEEIAAALTAAGFGPVKEAAAKALEDAAENFHGNRTTITGPRLRDWLRARAATVRGEP